MPKKARRPSQKSVRRCSKVSEAAPGYPDHIAFVAPERARIAEATRALIDAIMTTPNAAPSDLDAASATIEAVALSLAGNVDRTNGAGYVPRTHGDYLPRSPAVGAASPISPGTIAWDVEADPDHDGQLRAVATGTLTAAYEGPPGYVHGGVTALIFDEILGIVNIANGSPGMTATLSVRYRRPTPLFAQLRGCAWIEHSEGRRVQSKAQVWNGDTLCAEADGLFIQPNPERQAEYFGTDTKLI